MFCVVPNVAIGVPLTAANEKLSCFLRRCARVGGSTLTWAPVSTRKFMLFVQSLICNKRHVWWLDTLVAINDRPGRLTGLNSCKEACIFGQLLRKCGGTNKERTLLEVDVRGWVGGFWRKNDFWTVV